jgi:ribonuclease-3 family protein
MIPHKEQDGEENKKEAVKKDWSLLNGLALAYVGDAIYEIYIREHLVQIGLTRPNQLHKTATKYVSAKAQNMLMHEMLAEEDFLTEKEIEMYKRGRNAKSHTIAKNADIITYRTSTGFEALMGYLHLSKQTTRMEELINWCIHTVEVKNNVQR